MYISSIFHLLRLSTLHFFKKLQMFVDHNAAEIKAEPEEECRKATSPIVNKRNIWKYTSLFIVIAALIVGLSFLFSKGTSIERVPRHSASPSTLPPAVGFSPSHSPSLIRQTKSPTFREHSICFLVDSI